MHRSVTLLLRETKKYFKAHGRTHLPWRKTHNPYRVLVSEVMLQQTQVERVAPFYVRFVRAFPTVHSLAQADLSEVFQLWQGLGYNRRGKMLRDAAREIETRFAAGRFPKKVGDIESLPGIGPYTARAIAAFAFNTPEFFIETNIRTVFLHYCFSDREAPISDAEIMPLVERAFWKSKMQPRDFYAALMDYGSYLKRQGLKNNTQSKHYTKQSKFKGSRRQLRGQVLKLLLREPMNAIQLQKESNRDAREVKEVLARLQKEKLIFAKDKKFVVAK